MSNISKSVADLSPEEKRARLAQLLRRKARETELISPLSHGQRALWFLNQLAPESAAYNLMYAWRIRSDLDLPALQRTFQALIQRHPSLRTTYTARDGKPVQLVDDHQEANFQVTDASNWGESQLNDRVADEAHRPFDLEHGPLLRVNLFMRAQQEHILLLTVHHIAFDFPSLLILMNELFYIYAAEKAGTKAALPPLNAQYTDYVRWQADLLSGPAGERLWGFWQEQLAGELPVLNLPTDRPRPPIQTYRGAEHNFSLNEELTRRLRALAKAEGVTLYTLLLAAFQVLLHRYTGHKDILVGSPAGARGRAEFDHLVGYFANPVVLRADLSKDLTFKSFLRQVRHTVLAALDHQDFPFPLLVERLQPTRDPSRSPLCDVMFILHRSGRVASGGGEPEKGSPIEGLLLGETGAGMNWGGLSLETFALQEQVAQVDLTLVMVEAGNSISASLPYNTDLFDAPTIARMAGHFRTLLESVVVNPDQLISTIRLLTAAEQHQLLTEWSSPRAEFARDSCVHQLFEAQVERTPGAVAIVDQHEQLTYQELNRRANKLARHLRTMGVGPDIPVGICLERSAAMAVGLLGILKAGGAFLPLDPMSPPERRLFMLEDAQAPVLLTQQRLATDLSPQASVVCLDTDWELINGQSGENLNGGALAENLAYVIYTSGSTGRPKGVMCQHRSTINLSTAHQRAIYQNYPHSRLRVSLNAPLAFDSCVERILLLLFGHTVYILPEDIRHDPHALLAYVERHSLDGLDFTPSQLRLLIDAGLLSRPNMTTRHVVVGGEKIDEPLWRVLAGASKMDFFNAYGPTECTVSTSVCRIKAAPEKPNIGRPHTNIQVYILDEFHQPVPVGVTGEIYVGGESLGRGYLNRPALTAEKFIPNPFGQDPGSRLYKTGDLARYLPDGNIEFLNRVDDQVKIRGFRIEPREIAAALGDYQGLKDVEVLAREDGRGDRCLVAYIVPTHHPAPAVSEIKRFLRVRFPEYMIPAAFVVLDSLPLTPNGKVDRKALPAPPTTRREPEDPSASPRTSVEEIIARVWGQVLRLDRCSIHDNFFESGGHSLLATQLILRLRETFNVKLPLSSIFESPTIAGLAIRVVDIQLEQANSERLEEFLAELEHLSEEEVKDLLNRRHDRLPSLGLSPPSPWLIPRH